MCSTPQSQNFSLSKSKFFLQIFSLMIDIFTPKRISPHCPFMTNQRFAKILILTARCAFWLSGMMHTAELDSAVGSTQQSSTPQCDAHCGVFWEIWCSWESSSAVGCTLWSFTPQRDAHCGAWLSSASNICFFFVFSCSLLLSTTFYKKMSDVKKIPQTICDLQYNFHIKIFRHQREIAFVKLRIKTDTW